MNEVDKPKVRMMNNPKKNINAITEAGLSGFDIAKKMSLKIGSVVSVDGAVPLSEQFYWHEVINIDEDAVYLCRRLPIFERN